MSSIPDQFHFYYAKRKIFFTVLRGLIFLAFFALIVRTGLSDSEREAPLSRIPSAQLWFALFFFLSLLLWFIFRPLSQLSKLSRPILTISRDGIALKGCPPIPWDTIQRCHFASVGYGGITVYSVIRIKTSSAFFPKTILADTVGISRIDFDKQCRIYATSPNRNRVPGTPIRQR